jgi:hypothetical protein
MNPTNSSIQQAIELNSQAVALIANRSFEAAIHTLTDALLASKKILHDSVDEADMVASARRSLDQCMIPSKQENRVDSNSSHLGDADSDSDADECVKQEEQGKHFYVYRRAIRIPISIKEATFESSVLISVIIMFNLALAHQLMALEIINKQQASFNGENLLRKAAKLYGLAFNLQRDEGMENTILFTLATINNLGAIYQCLNESAAANKCFQHLLSTLMFLIEAGERPPGGEFEGYFRNTSNLIFHLGSAAAAA